MPAEAELRIRTRDGVGLAGTFRRGTGTDCVVIAGATGVKRQFYGPFARFLVGQGFSVLAFDYRGIGGSRPDQLKGYQARMEDWGTHDLDAALAWAVDVAKPRRLLVVGHSVGGQLLGLADHADLVDAAVFVGSQSGYWGHWPLATRLGIGALWFGLIPGLSPLLGKFPSSKLGLGEDLPRGVAEQWARWGRDPDYLLRKDAKRREQYAQLRLPLRMISIDGDFYAPHAAVDALAGFYAHAKVERLHLSKGKTTGHFTVFRPGDPKVWASLASWLAAPTAS
ncbi:MAG: alpha/beta fold hydrolase [Candidatus Thermoplasmatota archaeon]